MSKTSQLPPELKSEFEKCDPKIQDHIVELYAELSQLHKENAHLQVKKISLEARIEALLEEAKEQLKSMPGSHLSKKELDERAKKSLRELGAGKTNPEH